MHEIEVSLQVKIGIQEDKRVTVGNIATAIKNLGIEPRITEQIIQTIDENEVERHCGRKYQRGNGENRYRRGGISDREALDREIIRKASEIYVELKEKGELIGDADILIAASCLIKNMSLVTDDEGHFGRIKELEVENWLLRK